MKVVLASSSPQRRALLKPLIKTYGWDLKIINPNVEELVLDDLKEMACLNAINKVKKIEGDFVIGGDAFAYYKKVLLKPKNREEAKEMLREISGKEIKVYTGTAVKAGEVYCKLDVIKLKIKELSEEYIEKRVMNEAILKKAGAFSIGDVEWIDGDIFALMGLNIRFVEDIYLIKREEMEFI